MGYGISLKVWGPFALFSRPEMKVERVSYDIITHSAARGILEACMWHPGMRWVIDRIHVCAPIRFTNIRRNEVKSKLLASAAKKAMLGGEEPLYIATSEDIQQRASLLLRDVCYVIDAHFVMTGQGSATDSVEKFYAMSARRMRQGQTYHQPYLGCREFPASFALLEAGEDVPVAQELQGRALDLGFMLYDMDYTDPKDIKPQFFRAVLRDGILDVAQALQSGVVS